jgi:hypothetical protein
MMEFRDAARRAVATFVFSSLGVIGGGAVLGVDASTLELALLTGVGAVLNLAYRWAEAELR